MVLAPNGMQGSQLLSHAAEALVGSTQPVVANAASCVETCHPSQILLRGAKKRRRRPNGRRFCRTIRKPNGHSGIESATTNVLPHIHITITRYTCTCVPQTAENQRLSASGTHVPHVLLDVMAHRPTPTTAITGGQFRRAQQQPRSSPPTEC